MRATLSRAARVLGGESADGRIYRPATAAWHARGMTPTDAIVARANGQLSWHGMIRELLAHRGWWVSQPTEEFPMVWMFGDEAAYRRELAERKPGAIGATAPVEELDDVLADLDTAVQVVRFDPGDSITQSVELADLEHVRKLARATRVERAMRDRRFAEVRAYALYHVPYTGTLGENHTMIALPTERGTMLAAFTAEDAAMAFLNTGSEAERAAVRWLVTEGSAVFELGPQLADGVIVNPMGPATFGYTADACRDILTPS